MSTMVSDIFDHVHKSYKYRGQFSLEILKALEQIH